jgi:hypothetical protein
MAVSLSLLRCGQINHPFDRFSVVHLEDSLVVVDQSSYTMIEIAVREISVTFVVGISVQIRDDCLPSEIADGWAVGYHQMQPQPRTQAQAPVIQLVELLWDSTGHLTNARYTVGEALRNSDLNFVTVADSILVKLSHEVEGAGDDQTIERRGANA